MTTRPVKQYLNDITFSDLLFHAMINATPEQKNAMPETWLPHLSNRKTSHRFCLHQPYERQLIMWHYLGNSWVTIIGVSPQLIELAMASAGDPYKYPERRKDFINAMSSKKICATSSRELVMNMMMVDVNSKSNNYKINKDAEKISRHSKKWREMPTLDIMQKRATEAFEALSGIISNVLIGIDGLESMTGLSRIQCSILLVLMEDRYSAFKISAIADRINQKNRVASVTQSVNYLMKQKLVMTDLKDGERAIKPDTSILISEYGIKIAMVYLNGVVGSALKRLE